MGLGVGGGPLLIFSASDKVSYVNPYELGEALPSREERQAEWERALGLKPGVLAPEVVAVNAHKREQQVRRTVDEVYSQIVGKEA